MKSGELCDDPAAAVALLEREFQFERPGWHIRVRARTSLAHDGRDLRLDSTLTAVENEAEVFSREWSHRFPHDGD